EGAGAVREVARGAVVPRGSGLAPHHGIGGEVVDEGLETTGLDGRARRRGAGLSRAGASRDSDHRCEGGPQPHTIEPSRKRTRKSAHHHPALEESSKHPRKRPIDVEVSEIGRAAWRARG